MVKARTTTIERGSLHGYVTRKHAHFNQKISISHTGETSPPIAVWCSCGSSWTWIRPTRTRTGTRRRLRTMATTGQLVTTRSLPSMGWPAISSRRTAPGECVRGLRGPGELVFRHEYVVTNLAESVPAEWVFQTYQQRGTMENYIKEEKHGFFLDKTDSSGFRENQARMMVSLLAYNIVNFLHTLCLSGQEDGIGRAKGVETYFAFNPFCEKKNEKLAQWSGLSTSFLSYAGQQKKDYPQVRFSPTLEKVLSFFTSFKCPRLPVRNGRVESPPIGPPLR